jgi:DNA polymerase-3 subunit alpha
VSLPDIDIDFDDEGRSSDYVIRKYGSKQSTQIITYGKMTAIRDRHVYWICPLFEDKSKINSGMMPGKWNFFK